MTDYNYTTAVAVFNDRAQVHCAEQALKDAGFRDDQIGVVMRGQPETTADTAPDTTGTRGNQAASGAAGGVVAGGLLGGLLGAAASLLLPGVGPIVAGGILATTLAGAATGAVAGGILGALVGMGVPEEDARYYDEEFRNGRMIVTAKAGNRYDEAQTILRNCGGYDMHTRPAATTAAETKTGAYVEPAATNTGNDQTIRLHEEQLDIHKEPVQTGEVNIRKEVVTDTKTVDVPVSREEVVIERKSLDNEPARGNVGRDEQIRIPVSEEQVRVEKKPVATEEVSAHKEIASDTKRVTEDVKREEARVERKGDTKVRGTQDTETTDNNTDTTP